ncbi:hypothetical protein [Pseudodesulfovibrio tunisiensis]|uniref:hypothetical protein n=1 Tax=Pseudodesulfovibrio tunisiensis TaxID=463192 RepID=UPI001FB1B804|nr:hypothetical protein [Pseudodesulfovibrio tunisiensis]
MKMEMKLTDDCRKLICIWEEPVSMLYKGKEITINRKIRRRLRIRASGTIHPVQLDKLGSPKRAAQARNWLLNKFKPALAG